MLQALIIARQEKENLEMQRNRLQHKCKDLGEDFRLRLCKYIEDISVSQTIIWTTSSEFGTYRLCEQRRFRRACADASLRIRAVSPEPPLLAHTSIESRGTFRQKTRSLVPLNGWACAVKICHDEMLEDTNSLDGAQLM